jgi:Putative transposase/Transposase zinc-binding domain
VKAQAAHPRPAFRIADLVRRHRKALEAKHVLSLDQRRLLGSIAGCCTPALGGRLHLCPSCGSEHPVYHSCRKRGCPNCQALAQEKWIAARAEGILPVRHFHVTWTLPSESRRLAKGHPTDLYNAFFRIVGEILEELGRTWLQASLGWTLVLHTWKRDLGHHPHLHALVTAGGLSPDGSSFRQVTGKYLFPGEVMGRLLRGKMLDALRGLFDQDAFPELDPTSFGALMASLARHESWVVHAEPPFRDATHLLGYLGRYVHRIAISDSRLKAVTPDRVTFSTRHGKTASLPPVLFLQRFLQHVLPDHFHKVRHGGLYASARTGGRLERARSLLEQETPPEEAQEHKVRTAETVERLVPNGPRCPDCDGLLVKTNILIPRPRAPPGGACA